MGAAGDCLAPKGRYRIAQGNALGRCFCQLPRVRIVNNWGDLDLERIQLGVVYLFAPWSMWSVQNLGITSAVMARSGFEHLQFAVVNIDTVPESFVQAIFGRSCPAGAGETLWIRDGEIVESSLGYNPTGADLSKLEELLVERTERLLSSADG